MFSKIGFTKLGLSVVVLLMLFSYTIQAQDDPIGLILNTESAFKGYTLFTPITSTTTYLIDNAGNVVHTWESDYNPGNAVYLLEDGNLLRTANDRSTNFDVGGAGGRVELFSWEGDLLWAFDYSNSMYRLHHDVEMMPNGNILMIAWEYKTSEEAIAAGRDPQLIPENGSLWVDHIIEVNPATNAIVWEWHVWDHLVQEYDANKPNYGSVADHPERINLNYVDKRVFSDWNHINSIDYNAELDQILLSVHSFNEIWIIDHSTTTETASGPDGDILYRWGNPETYDTVGEKQLFAQHDAKWLDSGNILIFNNGDRRQRTYSSVDEIIPPVNAEGHYTLSPGAAYGPAAPVWSYKSPEDFYGVNISGAQRLPNGNTLICEGPSGRFFEVTPGGETVWEYINPFSKRTPRGMRNEVFRVERYALDYAGLSGKDLTPN